MVFLDAEKPLVSLGLDPYSSSVLDSLVGCQLACGFREL